LIVSPNENFLAILTTHTIHICVLPDPSHLTSEENTPLKPKIFTLGPTIHVTSRAPIVSALWHPLGVDGTCVVTVTADAIVRVWELSMGDRWSFDTPTTSIDLKKLADGTNLDQDFTASTSVTNKGFSPDSFEMQVAAASFSTQGAGGWNPMTLWIAMREGDVYALCPLLPQRWSPPPTLIPSLSVSVVTTVASIEDDPEVSEHEKLLVQQQLEWMGELDSQEPTLVEGPPGEPDTEIYNRPSRPGVVPRLQGPFELQSDPETTDDLDTSITDILVIGKKTETEELMDGEDDDIEVKGGDHEGLSMAVICLLSTSGQVRVYLDIEGVKAQWLPPRKKARFSRIPEAPETPSLLAFQAIDTMSTVEMNEDTWPVFTPDVVSRYNFFVTHHAAITFVSFTPWIFRLEAELNGDSEAGTDFRIGLLVNSQSSRERLYSQPAADISVPLAAAVALRDPDLGYFLLSATPYDPVAMTFDTHDPDLSPLRQDSPVYEREVTGPPLEFYEPRPVYQVPHVFEESSALPSMMERLRTSRHKTVMNQEVRLSPLTLQIFTDAHKVLSDETYRLGVAAAELFRRCDILQTELKQQITKANEVKGRIDAIRGVHRDNVSDKDMYEARLAASRDRQKKLVERVESMRKMVSKATSRPLSSKERAFVSEVKTMDASVSGNSDDNAAAKQQLWKRLEDVKRLQQELASEAETLIKESEERDDESTKSTSTRDRGHSRAGSDLRIPQDVRRMKLQQVQGLLQRETALVEAVTARLERLQTSA
jgi:nucleoporin NUP82